MSTFPVSVSSISPSLLPLVDDESSTKQDHVVRNTMKFRASIWGDQFLTYDEKEELDTQKQLIEELKEEVRKELLVMRSSTEPLEHMKLIKFVDVVQRLGLAYHFENDIEEALEHIYTTYGDKFTNNISSLENISIWFRLLRQQGFNVSLGIFKNFMDEKRNFKKSLCNDAQGMLALYEAAYMRVEGEEILDDALEFTRFHLGVILKDPNSCLKTQIQQALKQPLRKRLIRLEAVRYIPIYEKEASHNEILLKLAKLDYNTLQSMHKKELSQICKWWNDLDIPNRLPYIRDRVIEAYFWILGVYFEPQHARTRIFLVKTCMWLIVIDDTYDNYGTYEELEIFTEAVERWSISCLDMLPEYMKLVYQELVNHHEEMEELLKKEGKAYHVHYVKEMAKEYTRSLFIEAKRIHDRYIPTEEEYMSTSLVSCAYALMTARSYVGRDDLVTEDTFKWVATHPPLVKAICLILRLMNDITTYKEEQERCNFPSSIEYYQKKTGASEEEAREYLSKQVEDTWRVINRESLRPTNVPFPLIMPPLNLARVSDVLYKDIDNYKNIGKDVINHVKSLLVHPIT